MENDTNGEEGGRAIDEWNQELATKPIPDTVCLAVYLVIGVLGNSSVIIVYRTRKQLNKEDRLFIPILAIIDLIAGILNCSFSISINFLPVKYNSDIACKIMWFLSMYMTGASALTLMVIVIHRYLKICTPSGRQMTHKWKKIFLAIIFCGMVLVALPCFAFYGSGSVTSPSNNLVGQWCTGVTAGQPKVAVAYKVILFLLVFGVLVVLVVLYSLIGRVLYKRGMFSWKPNFTKEAPSATFDSGTLGTDNVLRLNINENKSKTDIVLEENKHAVPASHNVHSNAMDMQLQKTQMSWS